MAERVDIFGDGRVCRKLRRCRRFKAACREGLNRQEYLPLAMPQDARGQGLLLNTERSDT